MDTTQNNSNTTNSLFQERSTINQKLPMNVEKLKKRQNHAKSRGKGKTTASCHLLKKGSPTWTCLLKKKTKNLRTWTCLRTLETNSSQKALEKGPNLPNTSPEKKQKLSKPYKTTKKTGKQKLVKKTGKKLETTGKQTGKKLETTGKKNWKEKKYF